MTVWPPREDRIWFALWSAWGFLIAGLIVHLDDQLAPAIPWAIGGILIGRFGWQVFCPFASLMLEWYRVRTPLGRWERQGTLLRLAGQTGSEEYQRCQKEESYWMTLALPPLYGICHGAGLGAYFGTLCGFDRDLGISAAAGASIG